ncbi:MAG: insulinase family protein [Deltaproteobacteria bacterium]|nr:insulinase family protein [Deltaproteobacteria bacterium]
MDKPFKATLPNGLRVILLPKNDAPVVSWNLWANVGSVNETPETAGICHLIEHMLFKGTSRRPVGQIAKEVEASGGEMNAYTSFDETVFYINMSSKKLDVGLDILADAAADPTFDATELTREKEVVVEEISRAEDNPSQMVSEDLFKKVFAVHPYGKPIAGDRNTVREVSRQTVIDFYRQWYVASNLLLIGVGDFAIDPTIKRIEALFNKIPAGTAPRQEIPIEPPQTSPRHVTREMAVEGYYLDLALPAPSLKHPDVAALDLLVQILGGGASSRLEQTVREKKKLVSSISSSNFISRYPGVIAIGTVLQDGELKKPLQAIWEEMDLLRHEKVSAVELTRARDNIRSTRIYEKQTAERLARKLGFFEGLAEDLEFEEQYYRKISETTEGDLLELAQRYFVPEKLTLALCHPKGKLKLSPQSLFSSLGKPTSRKPKPTSPSVSSFTLSEGVRLLVRENKTLPILSMRSLSLGGSRWETKKTNGISHLVSMLLTKGTTHRTAREIAEAGENICGNFDGTMGRNLIGLSGTFLSEKETEGVELFFDLLFHPSFAEEEIKKEKETTYTMIRNQEDSLPNIAMRHFFESLYPQHPYGLQPLGTIDSVRKLKRQDLFRWYQQVLHPKNIVISISGDVDTNEIRERIEEKIRIGNDWKFSSRLNLPRLAKVSPPKKPKEVILRKKEKYQAHIVYGFLGTTLTHPDRYALDVMNAILAGQGGRLFLELRDKKGLAYSLSSSSTEGIEPGYFMVYMGCDPTKLEIALAGIKDELKKIATEKTPEEEISRAKKYLIGNYELELQKNSAVAAILASNEIYKIGWEELYRYPEQIEKVTANDILRVAQKYLRQDHSVLSVVRP